VDSDSEDGSVSAARDLGLSVVELDSKLPLTAARARNAGLKHLHSASPQLEFVQFVDGDCELVPGWLDVAERFLSERGDIAVVCGRRRERQPDRSVYNWLCDQEWDTPVGNALACGGDAMFRVRAFEELGGFNPTLIAGEEPEFCSRLREHGWLVWRLDADMTIHDAAMTRLGQWWTRTARGGHAYAEVSRLRRFSPMPIWQRERTRSILWAGVVPLTIVAGGILISKFVFLGVALYPAQICRIAMSRGFFRAKSWLFATFMTLAKFAELQGMAHYYRTR
jgi:GT2 family glycosyltransferase